MLHALIDARIAVIIDRVAGLRDTRAVERIRNRNERIRNRNERIRNDNERIRNDNERIRNRNGRIQGAIDVGEGIKRSECIHIAKRIRAGVDRSIARLKRETFDEAALKQATLKQRDQPTSTRHHPSLPHAEHEESALPSASMTRPFRVLGIQQIAIGALQKDALTALWVDLLGLTKTGSFKSEKENVDEDILTLGQGVHAVEIDLMQPFDAEKRPKVHEPALNHIGLWIDNLPAAVAWLESQGMRFTPGGIRKGASGHDVCFLHPRGSETQPRSGEGVLIELVQAPADVIAAHA
jgi:lactoylglutathione lyase